MFYPVLQCLSELKNLRQTNIPVYSFEQHQRLDETKYLYGATIIIGMSLAVIFGPRARLTYESAEGIMALHDPALCSLYDLKVCSQPRHVFIGSVYLYCRFLFKPTPISCLRAASSGM